MIIRTVLQRSIAWVVVSVCIGWCMTAAAQGAGGEEPRSLRLEQIRSDRNVERRAHAPPQGRSVRRPANERDSLALVQLYHVADGQSWTNRGQWLVGPVADWFGVTLNNQGYVTQLNLRENHLSGMIPAELGDLSELTDLNLAWNDLHGPIPSALGRLVQLRHLSLWENDLTGVIPDSLGQLTSLVDLLLYANALEGPIPSFLGDFAHLKRLWLDFNQFTGPIPTTLADLANLSELFLDANNLTGTVPPELANLTSLLSLYLGHNGIGGEIPPELGTMPKLNNLSLEGNVHTGTIPVALTRMPGLTKLLLTDNNLTGEIPPEFPNVQFLTTLHVANNNLTGALPESIGFVQFLRDLRLSGNQLTGNIPGSMSRLTGLRHLDLSDNQLAGELPASLSSLQRLERLDLSGNRFTGSVAPLFGMFRLRALRLRGNMFSGTVPQAFGLMPALSDLDLGQNAFTGDLAALFGRRTALKRVWLDQNQLSGTVPPTITLTLGLDTLIINDNHFEDLPDLRGLVVLDTVSVSGNRLTFEDLEPNTGIAGGAITYVPQDTVKTTLTRSPSAFKFSVTVGGSQNQYQWYRNDAAMSEETADSLIVDPSATVATYHCVVTNALVPGLTLTSQPLSSDTATGIEEPETALPQQILLPSLHGNHPNPFVESTRITIDVGDPGYVRLTVVDLLGRVVALPVDERLAPGRHEIQFAARGMPAGIYFYTVEMVGFRRTRQMVVVR